MALALLSEPLVLRSTRELGDFADDRLIPHRLGTQEDARFRLDRLNDREYLLAGNPPFTVSKVYVGKELTRAWESALRNDGAGNAWQVVVFAAPIDPEEEVSATGSGGFDPDTGALIENPADLMAYVMALHGRPEVVFPDLRAQAAAEGLRLKLNIDSAKSAKAWIDEIALSAGAIWTPSASRLYPSGDVTGSVIELDPYYAPGVELLTASLEDTADELRIAYDRSDASGRAQHAITLRASPQHYGGVKAELVLPHLWLPSNAESVGRRLLGRMAAKRQPLVVESRRADIRAGQWIRLVDSPHWTLDADPLMMVLAADVAPNAARSRLTGEVLLTTPTIEVVSHSVAISDTTQGGVDVSFRGATATFDFTDPNGRPLRGVRVTLDGSWTKVSGDDGTVSFTPVAAGEHDLLIERAGFEPEQTTFVMQ